MANPNSAYGIRPYAYMSGAPYNGAVSTYYVPASNATALYIGDPLIVLDNSSDGNGVPAVGIATAGAGSYITGSFAGISNNAGQATITLQQTQTPWLAAGQAAYIYVTDDPFLLYAVQEDSVGGALVSGAASRNAALVAGAGSASSGQSGWQLQSSSLNTTSSQMRIIRALQQADNVIGINAKWLCKINQHSLLNQTGV